MCATPAAKSLNQNRIVVLTTRWHTQVFQRNVKSVEFCKITWNSQNNSVVNKILHFLRCKSETNYRKHLARQHGDPVSCTLCDKVVHSEFVLRMHMRNCHGDRGFQCPHCDKAFVRAVSLKVCLIFSSMVYPNSNHQYFLGTHCNTHGNRLVFMSILL